MKWAIFYSSPEKFNFFKIKNAIHTNKIQKCRVEKQMGNVTYVYVFMRKRRS